MEILKSDVVVTEIAVAVFVPRGSGSTHHKNRSKHGFAYLQNVSSVFTFDSGEHFTLMPGDVIYLPKGSSYFVKSNPEFVCDTDAESGTYAINFELLEEGERRPFVIHVKGRDALVSALSKAEVAWNKKEVGFSEVCFASLYNIIRLLKKEISRYSQKSKMINTIAPALDFIDKNYRSSNIQMSDLASISGISEAYLRRIFNLVFSVSPVVYVKNLKINYAKSLLLLGEHSVTEVSVMSGFNDTAYFSREFKKATGVSPREYKN